MQGWTRTASGQVRSRFLGSEHLASARRRLRDGLPDDLLLMDFLDDVARDGYAPLLCGAWRDSELAGVAALKPSVILDSRMQPEAIAEIVPHVERLSAGLVKSNWAPVSVLWDYLAASGRHSLLDRRETLCTARAETWQRVPVARGATARPAMERDLESLVVAASASLREEGRPDPFVTDPEGFRAWVRSRLPRARVVEREGRVVFVAYADVRRSEGWLIQGVYTMPEERRLGYAAMGMSVMLDEAFDAGAEHVQLAVVDGNEAAIRLYQGLGFEPTAELRTILFH